MLIAAIGLVAYLALLRAWLRKDDVVVSTTVGNYTPRFGRSPTRRRLRKDWTAFRGKFGGKGWRSTESGEIRYQDEKPGEREEGKVVPGRVYGRLSDVEQQKMRRIIQQLRVSSGGRVTRTKDGWSIEPLTGRASAATAEERLA